MSDRFSISAKPSRSSGGFTLLEILSVFAILVVLAAILLPAIAKTREAANAAKCASNLRQIGSGLFAYAADHSGTLIPAAVIKSNYYWFDELSPYMGFSGDVSTFKFPDSAAVNSGFPLEWQLCPSRKKPPITRQAVGYGWNYQNFGYKASSPSFNSFTTLQQVSNPAKTIIIGDSKDADDKPANDFEYRYIYEADGPPLPQRHKGRGNYLLLDGHVESFAPEQIPARNPLWKKFK